MEIANVDIFKTVFNTRLKKFEYTVMFFELTNVLITFQIMINRILRSYLNKFVMVYLDDIVIKFNFIDEHPKHVQLIFNFFRKHQFFAKFTKCMLIKKKFMFCKHIIENDVIKFCQFKIKIISDWSISTNVHEIRQFLNLVTYYRRFVKKFAKIFASLSEFLKESDVDLRKKKFKFIT